MFSDCGGYLSGAIVPCPEHGGRMLLRPYTDVRQWPLSFVRPRNVFRLRRIPVGRYCSRPGTWGAYAIRPYTDVRQWLLSFVRPRRNPFYRPSRPIRRLGRRVLYTPYQMAPQGTNPTAADLCRALLFPTRNIGGVCFCAPTRTSDNGRCRSFAPEMFSDCGGYPTGAIVLGPEHRGRMQYAPTRTSDNGR